MIINTFKPKEMGVVSELFDPAKKLLSKLPKGTLAVLVLVFFCLYANTKFKEGKEWQDKVIYKQDAIEKKVTEGNRENRRQHTDIMIDLREVKEEQKIIIETIPEQSKQMIKQTQSIFEQLRDDQKERESHRHQSMNELQPINPELVPIEMADMRLTFDTDTIKKNLEFLEN
jgi:hypothetical protein